MCGNFISQSHVFEESLRWSAKKVVTNLLCTCMVDIGSWRIMHCLLSEHVHLKKNCKKFAMIFRGRILNANIWDYCKVEFWWPILNEKKLQWVNKVYILLGIKFVTFAFCNIKMFIVLARCFSCFILYIGMNWTSTLRISTTRCDVWCFHVHFLGSRDKSWGIIQTFGGLCLSFYSSPWFQFTDNSG